LNERQGLKTGTTTVGIICKDGVVLAAEKKATMGYLVATKEDVDTIKTHLTSINEKLEILNTQATKIKTQAAFIGGGLAIILTGILNFVLKLL